MSTGLVYRNVLILLLVAFSQFSRASVTQEPPNISVSEKQKFIAWKARYLNDIGLYAGNKPKFINQLIESDSPYLRQHAFNPVNWKPWSETIFQQSQQQNKLILLSIGYSTCHWCHVMNKDSFSSEEVAKFVNQHYLAIKVDRELSPHIDDYYMSALEQVKGEAGWPITAIINDQGLPVFIDSYLTEKQLLNLLVKVNQLWHKQPDFLIQSAKRIDTLVKEKYQSNIVNSAIDNAKITQQLLARLDRDFGGFIGNQKFPSESMLSYALDQLARQPNAQLENLIRLHLDRMRKSGIRDHLNGGFHRYSTTADWMIPHYEKMLYNQAQLIKIYLKAYRILFSEEYLTVAIDTADSMLKSFSLPKLSNSTRPGFITAIDADFNGDEGGYYLWQKEQLENLPINLIPDYVYRIPQQNKYGLLIKNISLDKFQQPVLEKLTSMLQLQQIERGKPYADNKVLTGWNGLAIQALVELSIEAPDGGYLEIAEQLAVYLWRNRYHPNTGILARIERNIDRFSTTPDGNQKPSNEYPLFLEDYAFLTKALINLFDRTHQNHWLAKARQLNQSSLSLFTEASGKILNSNVKGMLPNVAKTNDAEVFSASAQLVENSILLDRRSGVSRPLQKRAQLVNYLRTKAAAATHEHLFAAQSLNQVESSSNNYRIAARANASITFDCLILEVGYCLSMQIRVKLKHGWHVNSNRPLQEYLVGTEVKVPQAWSVEYPQATVKKLAFQAQPMSLYEGDFKISITRQVGDNQRRYLQLPLQVCSDSICLLPESFVFSM
jgi:uncharacterized protein